MLYNLFQMHTETTSASTTRLLPVLTLQGSLAPSHAPTHRLHAPLHYSCGISAFLLERMREGEKEEEEALLQCFRLWKHI